ncbi:hypothetical protein CYLTODRAFT_203466 [Cylindrobasidium torrendii FP15055 ss-10]|uniref:F-box domain-containing protein n=1 Tax=Cylindrobasidium torrendii FP15055 ss-10 TaxID=1314674 RepID=A0A0D7AX03_9AGAR|nr:hypothetical protein CYLTODRAFT_203466 [Cylindrobasidium torrendii FP15055 ss-10]
MPAIPLEIFEAIVANLQDDRESAVACSLVASAWLVIARPLFFRVVLTPLNVDEFISLASHPLSFIPVSLRDLAVTRNWDLIQVETFPELPHVTCLIAHNMHYSPTQLRPILAGLPALTNLFLDAIDFDSFLNFTAVVNAFPALELLSLSDISWEDLTWEGWPAAGAPAPTLKNLVLKQCYQHDVFSWFLSMPDPPLIAHLNLSSSVSPSGVPSIAQYLQRVGPQLRTLRLGFESFDAGGDAEDFVKGVNLEANAAGLKELWVDSFIGSWEITQVSTAGKWIIRLLEQLQTAPQRVLSLVVLEICGDVDAQSCEVNWKRLEKVLIRLDVKVILRVTTQADGLAKMDKSLAKKLPKLVAQKTLSIEYVVYTHE